MQERRLAVVGCSANLASTLKRLGLLAVAAGCLASSAARPQTVIARTETTRMQALRALAGTWQGKIAGKLPLVLHLRVSADGVLSAMLDSPSQGAMSLPCADVKLSSKTLDFAVPVVQGAYRGALTADGRTLTSAWQQRGQSMPLVFHQTATAGSWRQSSLRWWRVTGRVRYELAV